MSHMKLRVIVPTRDRPAKLGETLTALADQRGLDRGEYELIVVDDGSVPPAALPMLAAQPVVRMIRLEGAGPSAARNCGASAARGELLVFVDDDMRVGAAFLISHWRAHIEWSEALKVGSVRLPKAAIATPFGRFRQRLEDKPIPDGGGVVQARNFCTAANMAIERGGLELGVEGYSNRAERYMEELVRFGARHMDRPESTERARVNGPTRWGEEPLRLSAKKVLKVALTWAPIHAAVLALVRIVERISPNSSLLDRLYRVHLGAHLQRGYRRGLDAAHG
jgi:glycosyltransferase involved in cell wall biosynthesis